MFKLDAQNVAVLTARRLDRALRYHCDPATYTMLRGCIPRLVYTAAQRRERLHQARRHDVHQVLADYTGAIGQGEAAGADAGAVARAESIILTKLEHVRRAVVRRGAAHETAPSGWFG